MFALIQVAIFAVTGTILGAAATLPKWRRVRLPLVVFVVVAWTLVGEPAADAPGLRWVFRPPDRYY